MNNRNSRNLTLFEFIVCIHSSQLASGLLIMSSPMASTAGPDGWVSVVLGWFITSTIGVIIICTLKKKTDMNLFELLTYYFGKWIGSLFIILYGFYFSFVAFNTLLKGTEIVKVWIFPEVPAYQIVILLLVPFCILSCSGVQAIITYSMMVFFLTVLAPIFLIFSLKQSFHPLHLLPVLKDGIYPVLRAVKETITPYAGLEIAYFLYPFLQKKEKALKGIIIANTGTMILYLYITIICYVYFSPEGVKVIIWPVFQLLKGVHFAFQERLEIIYIAYYLMVFSTTIYPYLFFSTYSIIYLSKRIKHYVLIYSFVLVIVAIFFFFTPNVNQFLLIYSLMDTVNILFFFIFPVCFFLYIILFNRFMRR